MSVQIQVVFQGGGAKICALMAVCEVLKSPEFARRIRVTRAAGSSAGAIAAAMLGSGKPIEYFVSQIQKVGSAHLHRVEVGAMKGCLNVWRGKAYFEKLRLKRFFEDLFLENQGPRFVSDLADPTVAIYYTDLYTLSPRPCSPNDALPQALEKSCNFPLAFTGFRSGITDVDGGLAFNLPVDEMKAEETTRGRVIGISFPADFGKAGDLRSYSQLLFSAAIQSGVVRSQAIIGHQNVFPVRTEIGTFDFKRALNEGFGNSYVAVKNDFARWLGEWLAPFEESSGDRDPRFVRPSLSPPLPAPIIHQINENVLSSACIRTRLVVSADVVLFNPDSSLSGRYKTSTMIKFDVLRPVHLLQFDFEIGRSGSFSAANLLCAGYNNNGDRLLFETDVQELPNLAADRRSFRLFYYFSSQLTTESVGQPYVLEFEYDGADPYPKLGSGCEYSVLSAVLGDADRMVLQVAFPKSRFTGLPRITDMAAASDEQLERVGYSKDRGRFVTCERVEMADILPDLHLDRKFDDYLVVGRSARDVKRRQAVGFLVE